MAKGSHCQLTIRMMLSSECWESHCTGSAPKNFQRWAKMPFTGSISMFFHTSAETVGMTKKGAMIRMRTIPWPNIG